MNSIWLIRALLGINPLGSDTFAHALVLCEISVGLISCCLPAIFNLVRHGLREHSQDLFSRLNISHPLSGLRGKHRGSNGTSTSNPKDCGFVTLDDRGVSSVRSQERIYIGPGEVVNYATAYPVDRDSEQMQGERKGIPLRGIHIRDDIRIEAAERGLGREAMQA